MQETTIEVTPEVEQLIQKAARAAVAEYKRQEEKERKRDKYHNTFTLMKCYRDAAFHIENAISDGEQLELKGMTDEQQRTYLESVRRSRFKTLIMTAHIDKAVISIHAPQGERQQFCTKSSPFNTQNLIIPHNHSFISQTSLKNLCKITTSNLVRIPRHFMSATDSHHLEYQRIFIH